MGKHKTHRNASWKRDTLLLTCILRLRIQPSIPYPSIAELLLSTLPDIAQGLANKAAPRDLRPTLADDKIALKKWLEGYLEERYKLAEDWGSEPWQLARDFDTGIVIEILRVMGLNEQGFEVMGDKEVDLQIMWRKKGDWKAGSEPLGGPGQVEVEGNFGHEQTLEDIEHGGKTGWRKVPPFVLADAQVPELPDVSVRELQSLWNKTVGAEREEMLMEERKIFEAQNEEQLTRANVTSGSKCKGTPKNTDPKTEIKECKDDQQKIASLLQKLEAVRLKYQGSSPDQHMLNTHQQKETLWQMEEHPTKPDLPQIWTSFDQELEDMINLERLIHEHSIKGEATLSALEISYCRRMEGQSLSDMAGYPGDSGWIEMGSPT
ncbi:hypothetical protein EG329_009871 [Mollisiaceae sp. DMI_Dod_QoI]|nr:hypothetical protein EG329_009871 [Helotiales sp. DMI_Dod_QoI]